MSADTVLRARNQKAIVAMVLGLVSPLFNPLMVVGVLAIIFGLQGSSDAAELAQAGHARTGLVPARVGVGFGILGSGVWLVLMLHGMIAR